MKKPESYFKALVYQLKSENPDEREKAARELISLGKESVPYLAGMLEEADDKFSVYLIWVLVEIGHPAVPFAEQLLSSPLKKLRIAATEILGNVPLARSTDALIQSLRDENGEVRDGALWALSRNVESSLSRLIATLSDKSSMVRDAAAKIISSHGEKAINPLVRALNETGHTGRQAIMEILAGMPDKSEKHLMRILSGDDDELRCLSARALGTIQSGKSVPALIEAAVKGGDDTREACVFSLITIGQDSHDVLFEALKDHDFKKRDIASRVFAKSGRSASQYLSERVDCPDADTRKRIVRTLGWIKDGQSFDILLKCLSDEDHAVRDTAAWALGELGDPRCVDALVNSMSDESMGLNMNQAVYALSIYSDVNFVDRILPLLKHPSGSIRWKAALLFGLIKDRTFTGNLVERLNDEDPGVRRRIIASLAEIGDPEAIPYLKELMIKGPADAWNAARSAVNRLEAGGCIPAASGKR